MKKKPNVVALKVQRSAAGTTIPFDKIYFFRRIDRPLIPKIFGYALVLPVDATLLSTICDLPPAHTSHLKFHRDDAALRVPTGIDVELAPKSKVQAWWNEQIIEKHNLQDRVAVVPILTSKVKARLHPRYLGALHWYTRQGDNKPLRRKSRFSRFSVRPLAAQLVANLAPAISELAYLATPEPPPNDKIRPLCTVCPRTLRRLQGECVPGQLICYKSLDFNKLIAKPQAPKAEDAHV